MRLAREALLKFGMESEFLYSCRCEFVSEIIQMMEDMTDYCERGIRRFVSQWFSVVNELTLAE